MVLAVLVGGYAYWVSHPPSRYETVFQEAMQRQRQRRSQRPQGSNAYEDRVLGPVLRGSPARGDVRPGLRRDCLVVSGPFQVGTLLASPPAPLDLLHFAGLPGSWLDNLSLLSANLQVRAAAMAALKPADLTPAQLGGLQAELARTQWKPEDYVKAFEGSILDYPESMPREGLWALPGILGRESRLFRNDFTAQLERVRAGENFQPLPVNVRPDWDWLCGRHGILRPPAAPDCHDQFEKVRRQQAYLHLLTGILLERSETGQWPVSLEEMPGYQPLPELDRKAVHYYALGETLEVSWEDWSFKR